MKNKYSLNGFAWKIMLSVLFWITVQNSNAQSGISLSWNSEVGCQINVRVDKLNFEDIEESECIRVCQSSTVTYTLDNLPSGTSVLWSANGGTISSQTGNYCIVNWGGVGIATLSFTITNEDSIITKSICIEKMNTPNAEFQVAAFGATQSVNSCTQQVINFVNLSDPNMSYFWNFGDGTTSVAFEPSHTYTYEDNFSVTLIVTNSCNCSTMYEMNINVSGKGFEIICPGVVCENQTQIYSLPFDGVEACGENFNWTVVGGHTLSESDGTIEVLWDIVDQDGFGYVTFDPRECQVECPEITTIKIPVIQSVGTIKGPTDLCLGKQATYNLPQWPTTDFIWEIIGNESGDLADVIYTDQRNEIVISPLQAGVLTLRVSYMNTLLKCGGHAEFQINVSAPLEILGDPLVCQNEITSYYTSQNVPVTWNLVRANGTSVTNYTGEIFNYNFTIPGEYVLTAYANGYCQDQKTIVVVEQPPTPQGIVGEIVVCPNTPTSYTVTNPNNNYNYVWEVTSGGTIVGSNNGNSVTIVFNGNFPVTVSVKAENDFPLACSSLPKTISVIPKNVTAEIVNESSQNTSYTVCANSIAVYKVVAPGTSNLHTDGDLYTWSLSNPNLGSIINGQGTQTVTILWNNVTTTETVDILLAINKCTLTPVPQFSKEITIIPSPEIEIETSQTTVCAGPNYNVNFNVTGLNGFTINPSTPVIWNFGSGDITDDENITKSFVNNTSEVLVQTVTAYILNANGCGMTNIASIEVTILPNPPAIASVSSASGNVFCSESEEIDATLQVASNNSDIVSIQWYYNNSPISGATGNSLTINGFTSYQYGAYKFIAVRSNGCLATSNTINIVDNCVILSPCIINETVTNTSFLADCNTIKFEGTATGTPLNATWNVLGTGAGNFTINGTELIGEPGKYHIIHRVEYNCPSGGTAFYSILQEVVIPYKPDFSFATTCNTNNTFDVSFYDNSVIYSEVDNLSVQLMYSLTANYPSGLQPITATQLASLPAGNYTFELSISGYYDNILYPTCKKTLTVNLQGLDPNIEIELFVPADCHNTAVVFEFNFLPPPGTTYIWTFESGVQNTNATPSRVFNNSNTTYNVTVDITSPLGCTRTLTLPVYVPKPCFDGDIISDPSPAEACQGQTPITLLYQAGNDDCEATSFIWMNDNNPITEQVTDASITVNTPGNYWVKVYSADGCEYNTPSRISPIFHAPPHAKIVGSNSFCNNDLITIKAVTNAPDLNWTINGYASPENQNSVSPVFTNFIQEGQNTILLEAISAEGCKTYVSHHFTVSEAINFIDITATVYCEPYLVVLSATASNGNPTSFYWSNGATGETIEVSEGGAYRVTAVIGNCSTSAEIDIPKNPENYLWVFPKGCFVNCEGDLSHIIGPVLPFEEWSWEHNGDSQNYGNDTVADDYYFSDTGSYTMTISNNGCSFTTEPLHYQATECQECEFTHMEIKSIIPNNTPYCSYTVEVNLSNNTGVPLQVTISDVFNNVIITPSTFTALPTFSSYLFTVIPLQPFTNGATEWILQGYLPSGANGYFYCKSSLEVEIPTCGENKPSPITNLTDTKTEVETAQVKLIPNPAKESVAIQYALNSTATIVLYDLTGRQLTEHKTTDLSGVWNLNIDSYPAGIYIVVIKQTNGVLWQHKLVIE